VDDHFFGYKNGMNFLPLWTEGEPTKSGVIVERRDHVLITFEPLVSFASSTFFANLTPKNGLY
jgi:hypothetical protein